MMGLAVLMGFSRLYLYVHFPTDSFVRSAVRIAGKLDRGSL